jgi:uncharacterized RDD family membrane protein YckC
MAEAAALDTLTHIETPENVRLAFRLAGPGSRLGAYLLDLAIRITFLWGLSTFVAVVMPFLFVSGLPMGVWLVGLFLVEWGYGCLFEGWWNGQTPGKKILRLRVMKAEGYPISFHEAMLRNLLRVADGLPLLYGVGFFTAISNRKMQRIGDLVAGTIVIRETRQRLRSELPGIDAIEPIPQSSFRHAYRPSERTLDVVERLFRRRHELGEGRVEEIARILANPLAQKLTDATERTQARRYPSHFLLRLLRTFQTTVEGPSVAPTRPTLTSFDAAS